jgi:CheY-like chemotaxis protein
MDLQPVVEEALKRTAQLCGPGSNCEPISSLVCPPSWPTSARCTRSSSISPPTPPTRAGCTTAGSSFDLIQEFQTRPGDFDALVTDLAMPGMSGFDVVRRILEIRADLPIVMTSGYVRPEDQEAAQRLGVRGLILLCKSATSKLAGRPSRAGYSSVGGPGIEYAPTRSSHIPRGEMPK